MLHFILKFNHIPKFAIVFTQIVLVVISRQLEILCIESFNKLPINQGRIDRIVSIEITRYRFLEGINIVHMHLYRFSEVIALNRKYKLIISWRNVFSFLLLVNTT